MSLGYKKTAAILFIAFVLFFAIGSGNAGASQEPLFRAGLILPTFNVFFEGVWLGVKETVEAAGGELIFAESGHFDVSQELTNVEDMIERGIDVLFFCNVDQAGSSAAVRMANEAGIPVFGLLSLTQEGEFVTVTSADDYESGKIAAEWALKQVDYKAEVIIVDGPQVSDIMNRVRGFTDTVDKYPDAEIVGQSIGDVSIASVANIVEDLLIANRNANVIFGPHGFVLPGAVVAMENMLWRSEVVVVDIDGLPEGQEVLADGRAGNSASVGQFPKKFGSWAVEAYLLYREGKDYLITDVIVIPTTMVTPENVDEFDAYEY